MIAKLDAEFPGRGINDQFEKCYKLLQEQATVDDMFSFAVAFLVAIGSDELNAGYRPAISAIARTYYLTHYNILYEEWQKKQKTSEPVVETENTSSNGPKINSSSSLPQNKSKKTPSGLSPSALSALVESELAKSKKSK